LIFKTLISPLPLFNYMKNKKQGWIIVIAGPHGVGETTISKALVKILPRTERLVTTTSRPRRTGEKNGREYNFISKKDFENKIKKGYFLEYTYYQNRDAYYGTIKKEIEKKINRGINLIANLDIIGTKAMIKNFDRVITIFIRPDKFSNLSQRLKKRQPDIDPTELKKRLDSAKKEIKTEMKYYQHIVVNPEGQLDKTTTKVTQLIKKTIA